MSASSSQPETQQAPEEKTVSEATARLIEEGVQRIRRPWIPLVSSGVMGGLEIGIGLLAKYVVVQATGNDLLGSIAFSFAFVILFLAHSELFTEGFLVPVTAVVAGKASLKGLLRFWLGTFVGNLIGALVIMFVLVSAYPSMGEYLIHEGEHYGHMSLSVSGFFLATLGGMMLTLVTRMHQHSDETMPKVVASMFGGTMLAGSGMLHSILDTHYIIGAMLAGSSLGLLDWAAFIWWVILGNMAGGLFLVSGVRFIRAHGSLANVRWSMSR